jgi:nitrogen regulatory protein P-II 1
MIVMLARESAAERLCEMIHTIGHTGRVGDGLIWTSRVEGWRRISAPVENGWMV